MSPDLFVLLRLCAAGSVILVTLWAFARHPRAGVFLLLCPDIIDVVTRHKTPDIEFDGLSITSPDVIAACALAVVAGRLVGRRLSLGRGVAGTLALLGLTLVSVYRGIADFGVETAVNESREYLWFLAAALYIVTAEFGWKSVTFAARAWTILACAYVLLSVWRWSTLGFTSSSESILVNGQEISGRPVPSLAALLMVQAGFLLLTMCWNRRRYRMLTGGLLLTVVLLEHRTVWVVMAIAIVAYLVLGRAVGRERLSVAVAMACTVVAGYVSSVALSLGTVGKDLQSSYVAMHGSDTTFAWRVTGWKELLSQRSDLLDTVIGRPFGTGFARIMNGNLVTVSPHNWYIQTFLRIGILGVVLLLGVYILSAIALRSGSRASLLGLVILVTQVVFYVTYGPNMEQGVALGLVLWLVRYSPTGGGSSPGSAAPITIAAGARQEPFRTTEAGLARARTRE